MFKKTVIFASTAILCAGTLLAGSTPASAACVTPEEERAPRTVCCAPCRPICPALPDDWWDLPALRPDLPQTPDQPTVPEEPDQPEAPEAPDGAVSAEAQRVAELVNEARRAAGLAELELDGRLSQAAQQRALEIEESFAHTRPDGSSCFTVLADYGIAYRACGENIARGSRTPEAVMDGWMNSAGHRANILSDKFTAIGVGCYADAAGVKHWVQLFAAQRAKLG